MKTRTLTTLSIVFVALLVDSTSLLVAPTSAANDKTIDESKLTVDRIFGQNDFKAEEFSAKWMKDSSGYTTLEDSKGDSGGKDIVLHDPATGDSEVLVPADHLIPPGQSGPLDIEDYTFSDDKACVLIYTNSKRVWRQNTRGDYWVLDRSGRLLKKLGGQAKPSTLMFAKLSPNNRQVAYVIDGNLFVEQVYSSEIEQLTHSKSDEVINGTFDWVYEEEFGLRDGFRFSPDGGSIAYWQINTKGVPEFFMVNNTDELYPKTVPFKYPKVGQRNPACRVGIVNVASRETRWLEVPGDLRDNYIARMEWPDNSKHVALQQLNRRQNTNRVMLATSREVKTILTETDDAWVDVHDEMFWLEDGSRFTWLSERDGWRHVYLVSRDGRDIQLATPGEFDVIELLHVDEQRGWLYFTASPENPTQQFLYRCRLDGSECRPLTPPSRKGTHDYQISPDGRWAIHRWSTMDRPPKVALIELNEHRTQRVLVKNKSLRKKYKKLDRQPVEMLRVPIGEGVVLDGWCLKPPSMESDKKYPLLIYVYGEPAGQTVRDRWGGNRFLWHLMLAQQGYVVMSVDNRGTPAPRGRAWRKIVYHQVGIMAPQDQAAAVRSVLSSRSYLDPDRVGVWGWSGGGSMTLNAMLKFPDLYATGIAVAPVPNQRYYDTIYQERYMGLPGDNPDGYFQGSTINFAHQLKGNLLLIHGTGDDNCHYQMTELLINELVRHDKPFDMMSYPNRSHAIREGKNTTLHMRKLMTRYLHDKLPAGPR